MALSRPKYDYGLNLCYNCGNTHLPFPCVAPLRRCELCHCLGHMGESESQSWERGTRY